MRKIVSATYMTLDGDMHGMERWHFGYFNEGAVAAARKQLFSADALIMGSRTHRDLKSLGPVLVIKMSSPVE